MGTAAPSYRDFENLNLHKRDYSGQPGFSRLGENTPKLLKKLIFDGFGLFFDFIHEIIVIGLLNGIHNLFHDFLDSKVVIDL